MEIRNANLSDVDSLLPLYSDLGYPTEKAILEKRLNIILNTPDYGCLVAEQDGRLVGFIGYAKLYLFEADGSYYRILALSVLEEARRKGIASQLINAVKELAAKDDAKALGLNSGLLHARKEAYAFYEALGFERVSTGFVLDLESSKWTELST